MLIADYFINFVDSIIGFLIIFSQFITSKLFCDLFSIDLVRNWVFLVINMDLIIGNEFLLLKSVFNIFSMNN